METEENPKYLEEYIYIYIYFFFFNEYKNCIEWQTADVDYQ